MGILVSRRETLKDFGTPIPIAIFPLVVKELLANN
jgi:hypothetical protein